MFLCNKFLDNAREKVVSIFPYLLHYSKLHVLLEIMDFFQNISFKFIPLVFTNYYTGYAKLQWIELSMSYFILLCPGCILVLLIRPE